MLWKNWSRKVTFIYTIQKHIKPSYEDTLTQSNSYSISHVCSDIFSINKVIYTHNYIILEMAMVVRLT